MSRGRLTPWERGAVACEAGLLKARNPYPLGTIASKAWARGWEHENARLEEKERNWKSGSGA